MPRTTARWVTPALGLAGAICLAAMISLLGDRASATAAVLFAALLLGATSVGALAGNRFLARRMLGISSVGAGFAIGYLILQSPFVPGFDGQPVVRAADGWPLVATVAAIVLCAAAAVVTRRAMKQGWLSDGIAT